MQTDASISKTGTKPNKKSQILDNQEFGIIKGGRWGSNPRPLEPQSSALTG